MTQDSEPIVVTSKEWWNHPNARHYEILYAEEFKPGVKRLHVRNIFDNPPTFYLMYCKDECLPDELANSNQC